MAQHMRAFLAAMATTAFQYPRRCLYRGRPVTRWQPRLRRCSCRVCRSCARAPRTWAPYAARCGRTWQAPWPSCGHRSRLACRSGRVANGPCVRAAWRVVPLDAPGRICQLHPRHARRRRSWRDHDETNYNGYDCHDFPFQKKLVDEQICLLIFALCCRKPQP